MKVLKARLYEVEKNKLDQKKQEAHQNQKEIAWGSQIRSYTLQPYQLIKDHRTGFEAGNVNAILDGELDGFIKEYLLKSR